MAHVMTEKKTKIDYKFYKAKDQTVLKSLGKEKLLEILGKMLLIRHLETRAEAAYQQGLIGGFFHTYTGQEAIQTSAVEAIGVKDNWWTTTYRCHALAYLCGVTPAEIMSELYGRSNGNAMGRGGSMHLYSDRLLGGHGIVGGHLPIATGAGFSIKYQVETGVSVCFLGDGAFIQGAVHESLNLASLWDLPCIYVVENNQWGMGTAVKRAVCSNPIAESFAKAYGMEDYTLDGMDFLSCYCAFKEINEKVKKTSRPILVEAVTERFRGHSISDPALYRTKEELAQVKVRDPIILLKSHMIEKEYITEDEFSTISNVQKKIVIDAMDFASKSPNPDPINLEQDVFAP